MSTEFHKSTTWKIKETERKFNKNQIRPANAVIYILQPLPRLLQNRENEEKRKTFHFRVFISKRKRKKNFKFKRKLSFNFIIFIFSPNFITTSESCVPLIHFVLSMQLLFPPIDGGKAKRNKMRIRWNGDEGKKQYQDFKGSNEKNQEKVLILESQFYFENYLLLTLSFFVNLANHENL